MKMIRICQLYKYFFNSASTLLERAFSVKESYIDGKISYKRARKELDQLFRVIGQRLELCRKLYEGEVTSKWCELWKEYTYLTQWSAA